MGRPVDTDELDLTRATLPHPQRIAGSPNGAVATAHGGATEAGVRILAEGGNAIDAAVAAAFALGVCEPAASGLGGQTMLLLHVVDTRTTIALDGSSRAPNRVVPGALGKAERLRGYRATTVPSTPATLAYAAQKYGTRPLSVLLQPAIELARDGYAVTELQRRLTQRELKHLRSGTAGALFLKGGQRAHPVGYRFKQPALDETLRTLAAEGVESFYQGSIAKAIDADMVANEGLLRLDDLAQVPWPIERRPVGSRFGPTRVLTMPPPGAGPTLAEMLNIVAKLPPKKFRIDTPVGAVMLAETIRRAFLDRRDRPFDPDYYVATDNKKMLTDEHAGLVARQVKARAIPTRGETTHLSVIDRHGNAVALTQSIERVYGSCAATEELGFLYNNYMSAFEYDDIAHPYHLRPNASPWASVAPTIAFRGRRPWLSIGSPGSERITSSILQVLLRLGTQGPLDAVTAPRLHCSTRGRVSLEATRMRSDIVPALQARGYDIDPRDPFSFYLGCVQLVVRDGKDWIAVADPRRDGAAGVPT